MITLEEAIIMGTNAPRIHQRIIRKLLFELTRMYDIEHSITLEPLSETMLDEGQTSPTPDIILLDNVLSLTPVIIEITHSTGIRGDFLKVQRLIDSQYYGIQEGFVYDYKRNEWHKYKLGIGDITDRPSFCEAINLDLTTLL
jgi:hypothetical protein